MSIWRPDQIAFLHYNLRTNTIVEPVTLAPPSDLETFAYYVDPVNGSNADNGSYHEPCATIAHVLTLITDNDTNHRYIINILGGPVSEAAITWKPWVSLSGNGRDVTVITSPITYTATVDPDIFNPPRFNFLGCRMSSLTLNCTLSINTNIRCIDATILNYTCISNVDYNTNPNNFFLESCNVGTIVCDGALHIYDNSTVLSQMDINLSDNLCPPFVELVGGLCQGEVSITNRGILYSSGALMTCDIFGISGIQTPHWETNCMTTGVVSGALNIINIDEKLVSTNIDFVVNYETMIFVDATAGNRIVTLPNALYRKATRTTIKKVDATVNTVTIATSGGTIDNAITKVLTAANEVVEITSDALNYWIV